jgi:cytochrome c-type biogenesis protein CcmH/NrfF
MKLKDKVRQMSDEGKSVEEITDYILELKKEEDRRRTI